MSDDTFIGGLLITFAVIIVGMLFGLQYQSSEIDKKDDRIYELEQEVQDNPDKPCEEDMPCWNCTTMGNLVCESKD